MRIRGRCKNGRGYERLDYLPVTSLNVGLQRQNDGLSEGQVARNVKQAVLQKLGSASEDDAIMELSEEVYFLDGAREWTHGLANARFPLPVFCPLDSVQEAREGHLADLTYVKLRKDGRVALLARLPYVGEGWYAKPACAHMLEAGVATWQDFLWSLDATAHMDPGCLAWALRKMEEAWPEQHWPS